MGYRQIAVKDRTHVTGRKKSIRRTAVRFLRNLGHTSRTRDAKVRQAKHSEIVTRVSSGNNEYSKYQKPELAGNSIIEADSLEFAIPEEKVYEMARHTQFFSEMSTGFSPIEDIELPGSTFNIAELDTGGFDTQADHGYSGLCVSPERPPTISAASQRSGTKIPSLERSHSSHLRAIPTSSFDEMSLSTSDPQSLTALITSFDCKANREDLNRNSKDVPMSEMSSFLDIEEEVSVDPSAQLSTREHVEWLREFFTVAERLWQQKLSSMSELLPIYSRLSGRNMFELGINSFKRFFEGMPGYTFDQIFALMHVAWAYAYMLHGKDKSYCWGKFYQDMLPWQYLMFERSSQLTFIRVVEKLMGSESLLLTSEPGTLASDWSDYDSLMLLLKRGRILKDCSTFLAGKNVECRP